ncbi:N-methyl-L-tryptophan oxidase [Natronorubrum daqingense]|uniref:N-methyltryptophan oxidase n=1 Tax=Natronorubrum daqingense TaxID=588898 RepID=A0A1N7ES53_9EURY|nr:N-methyl-L-tryptophan oxidase [Natronorubrum daqingense]APX97751.1 N-methyltryptophan oxidase [Natronorubrum daqingense]SIR90910.1 sarcosine oxidase [Natronorubrum daqingense]
MTRGSYDAIVLGVGGMGSAAVYHLAKRGVDVLGIERYDVPHGRGSSHGDTRIFRLTQPEHPSYVPLAERARTLWRELEAESGADLLTETGSIHAGPAGGSHVSDAVDSCEAHDLPHEVLSGSDVNERFPGYELPADHECVYQPDGGFLACERAISTHVRLAHEHGATVRARERVLEWESRESGVEVRTDRGTYDADHLVVAAGAWAANQLPLLEDALSPQRRVMCWLQPETPAQFAPDSFPVFSVDVPEGKFYGFPVADQPGFKFGRTPAQAESIDPDDWADEPTLEDEQRLRKLSANRFPNGDGPTLRLATCIVTRSLDGHFYLDTHPEYSQVSIAAGFTGHGFKFTSVVGEVLADFATDGETEHPIDVHRLGTRLA